MSGAIQSPCFIGSDLPNVAIASIVVCGDQCLFLKRNKSSFELGIIREIKEEEGLDADVLMCVETWIGKPVDTILLAPHMFVR